MRSAFVSSTVLPLALALALAACSGAAPESATAMAPIGTSAAAQSPAAAAAASVPLGAADSRPAAASAVPPRQAAAADPSAALYVELQRAIGGAACRDDAQCRTLALGSKACGGPEGYIAWSVATGDAKQIEAAAERYRQARQARNQRLGLVSDCAMVPEPTVRCVPNTGDGATGNQCRAVAGRGGPTLLTR